MVDCSAVTARVFPYVDGELAPPARAELEDHLAQCAACHQLVEREVAFREASAAWLRPEPAPDAVRARVSSTLAGFVARRRASRRSRWPRRLTLAAAALALVALGGVLGVAVNTHLQGRTRVVDLAAAAVEQHQKLARDVLPADITGVSPKGAEAWFRSRLAFNVSLPELPNDRLTFLGGRIANLREIETAALQYQLEGKHVSLFIMPEDAYRRVSPGDRPRFTVISYRGYDVIMWRSHGTGYTLVSEVGGRSCLVCHSPEEKLEPLPHPSAHL
jgi:mycothiol system anti-sigma-R factor